MKVSIKTLAVDVYLGIIRLAVEVSNESDSFDFSFFCPVSNTCKPTPEQLEEWIFSKQIQAEQIFNGRFGVKTVVGAVAPVTAPAVSPAPVTAPAVSPAPVTAPAVPVGAAKPPVAPAAKPATLPTSGPKPIMPAAAVPSPAAKPMPPAAPVKPAPASPAPASPVGTLYGRTNPEHMNQLRNLIAKQFGAEWSKNQAIVDRAKLLIPLLDQKVVLLAADGKTVHPTFIEKVTKFMAGEIESV